MVTFQVLLFPISYFYFYIQDLFMLDLEPDVGIVWNLFLGSYEMWNWKGWNLTEKGKTCKVIIVQDGPWS